jgi:hypothetical protein
VALSNAANTIHVDDLVSVPLQSIWNKFESFGNGKSRNFALNPGEGLKIHPFKNAHTQEAMADRELDKLGQYMLHIANIEDFRTLKHKAGFLSSFANIESS